MLSKGSPARTDRSCRPVRLFLYGTLMRGSCNAVAGALHRHLGPGTPAAARGWLQAIPDAAGWYPALVPDPAGGPVHGMVHDVLPGFGASDLAALDAYEDCRGDDTGEYRREIIVVTAGAARLNAAAYVYNAALPAAAVAVPGGDFHAFLAEHGLAAFR
jgi:gamma-glutamylcyclotransferase (GGCT)/AIG2-like uncharacterized protein YtfP